MELLCLYNTQVFLLVQVGVFLRQVVEVRQDHYQNQNPFHLVHL